MEYDILRRPLWSKVIRPRVEKQAHPYPAPVKIAEVSHLCHRFLEQPSNCLLTANDVCMPILYH